MDLPAVSKNNLAQSPTLLEAQHNWQATKMNLISKIALIALVAIAAAVTTVVLFGLTLTGASPYLLVGSLLSTPLLMIASGKAADAAEKARISAGNERGVAAALEELTSHSQDEINSLSWQLSIDPASTPYTNEEFNILMARFGFWDKQARTALEKSNRHIYKEYADSELQKIDESKVTPQQASLLRYTIRDTGFRLLENEAIPAMLQTALILQVLINSNLPPNLEAIGTLYPKPMAYRLSEQIYDQNDVYMTFNDTSRSPLTTQEIVRLFTSTGGHTALRQRVFA